MVGLFGIVDSIDPKHTNSLMKKHFDFGSLAVILLTLVLFAVALVAKGFSHDLLLEAGVFLVSVKLVLMSYKNSVATIQLRERVDDVLKVVRQIQAGEDAPR
jgi:hypothetical protein